MIIKDAYLISKDHSIVIILIKSTEEIFNMTILIYRFMRM